MTRIDCLIDKYLLEQTTRTEEKELLDLLLKEGNQMLMKARAIKDYDKKYAENM